MEMCIRDSISTGCLWNGAIDRYLEGHSQIRRLVFAVDNDYLCTNLIYYVNGLCCFTLVI